MAIERPAADVSYATATPAEAPAIRRLLDRAFDGRPGVLEEFPALEAAIPAGRTVIARQAGEVVAHAAWSPLLLRSTHASFSAAGIGLVTTAPEARGKGHAGRLVEACVAHGTCDGASLALLFAGPRTLYTRLGFVPAGRERITLVHPRATPSHEGRRPEGGFGKSRVRSAHPDDLDTLHTLHAAHPLGGDRSLEQFARALAIRETHAFVLEQADRVVAYCVEGKGRDLEGVVHDWGGPRELVGELIEQVVDQLGRPLFVLSPGEEPAPAAGRSELGALAQLRVLDEGAVGSASPVEAFGDAHAPARHPIYVWGLDSV